MSLTLSNIDEANRDELRAFAKAEKLAGYSKLNAPELRELIRGDGAYAPGLEPSQASAASAHEQEGTSMSARAAVLVAELRHYRVRPIVLVARVIQGPKAMLHRSVHVPISREDVANLARTYEMITSDEHARQVELHQIESRR